MAGLIFLPVILLQAESPMHLLCAILCHEAGHLLTALFFSREMPQITFTYIGIRLSYIGLSRISEQIAVSLAGPFFSLLFGMMLHSIKPFSLYSISLGIINLLPVRCLDGGGILRAASEKLFLPQTSHVLCHSFSVITTLLIFTLNCAVQLKYGTNLSLAFISVFLILSVLGKDN